MLIEVRPNYKPRRADSDLQVDVTAGYRDVGRVNRVGRKWIARFEVPGRDAFEADPFTSKRAALAWMETEARSYHDLLAETPGFIRFRLVETRNGMHAGSLADLVDVMSEARCPIVFPTADRGPPTYHVPLRGNDPFRSSCLGYVRESRKMSGMTSFHFLIESPEVVERLKREFPRDIKEIGEVVLSPNPRNKMTIEEARADLVDQGRFTR
ncbi:hypothetical protein D3C71_290370 [compost metagenome]